MLLAPDRALAVDGNLSLQQTVQTMPPAGISPGPQLSGHKRKIIRPAGHLAHEFNHMQHGPVVDGNGVMISALQGPDLGPATVRVLRGKDIIQSMLKSDLPGFAGVCAIGGNDPGQKAQFRGGGIIVEGANIIPAAVVRLVKVIGTQEKGTVFRSEQFAGGAEGAGEIRVFAPPTSGRLKRNYHVCDLAGSGFGIIGGGLINGQSAGIMNPMRQYRLFEPVGHQFGL